MRIRIYADCADPSDIEEMNKNLLVHGFTTNPTLMRKARIGNYEDYGRKMAMVAENRPISFEVIADDFGEMICQGRKIAGWGPNVNVKIPVTNTRGEFSGPAIKALAAEGVALNITAIFTLEQVKMVAKELNPEIEAIYSVFAGRIADTGIDPVPQMRACKAEIGLDMLLWASPRELLNIFQADEAGCDIITCTPELIAKLALVGKDLTEYSCETVQMFHRDALAAGYTL